MMIAEIKFDGATVGHIQLVTSLIEGRLVGLAEIIAMLDKILRQHSIDSGRKIALRCALSSKNSALRMDNGRSSRDIQF